MARVSRDSAPEVVDYGPAEDRTGHFDGYTVNFTSIREDFDLAPVLKGLPGDRPTTELCAPACHAWKLPGTRPAAADAIAVERTEAPLASDRRSDPARRAVPSTLSTFR